MSLNVFFLLVFGLFVLGRVDFFGVFFNFDFILKMEYYFVIIKCFVWILNIKVFLIVKFIIKRGRKFVLL